MKLLLACAFLVTALNFAFSDRIEKSIRADASELNELQGAWLGSEVGQEGQVTLTFTGRLVSFQGALPQEWYKGVGILDESPLPKHIDFLIEECSIPDFIGRQSLGIYKLDEDGILTLAGTMPGAGIRPSIFHPGDGVRVFRLKKKDSVEPGDLALLDSRLNNQPIK